MFVDNKNSPFPFFIEIPELCHSYVWWKFSAFKELCPLDVDKENVIQEEIEARLARVEKIEMARPIKSSYGQPKITDFDHLVKIHTSSVTFKNPAHKTPTLQSIQDRFKIKINTLVLGSFSLSFVLLYNFRAVTKKWVKMTRYYSSKKQ